MGGDSLLVLLLKENLINLFKKTSLKSKQIEKEAPDIISIEQILKTPTIKELSAYLRQKHINK